MTQGIQSGEPDARLVYADIIALPHWQSVKHPHMSRYARAAQFSPFAALDGYEEMVDEEAREVGQRERLGEAARELLDRKLGVLAAALEQGMHPTLTFRYFAADSRKDGCAYAELTERVRRVDMAGRTIQFYRKTGLSQRYMELAMEQIQDIRGELTDEIE